MNSLIGLLSPSDWKKLLDSQVSFKDLKTMKPFELAHLSNIDIKICQRILRFVKGEETNTYSQFSSQSAFSTYNNQINQISQKITSFSSEIDKVLGGGIEIGKVTEICGVPGIGKTQFGIQFAINVQLPQSLGGIGGRSLYIDTEGSFMTDRVKEMSSGFLKKVEELDTLQQEDMSIEDILGGISYLRVKSQIQQIAVVNVLKKFVEENQNIKLVVLDSVTFFFRHAFKGDYSRRTRILQSMAMKLSNLAKDFGVAVLVVNQMTTKIKDGSSYLSPALGDSWAHASPTRIVLYRDGTERKAFCFKSTSRGEVEGKYSITNNGIRDESKKRQRYET